MLAVSGGKKRGVGRGCSSVDVLYISSQNVSVSREVNPSVCR